MSTEPRDSSKLISGGPRTVLLRHRARHAYTRTRIYVCIHGEDSHILSAFARACARLKFVVFLKRQLPPVFHPLKPRSSSSSSSSRSRERYTEERDEKKRGEYIRGEGEGRGETLLIVVAGR